jgi:hypothetical protein
MFGLTITYTYVKKMYGTELSLFAGTKSGGTS